MYNSPTVNPESVKKASLAKSRIVTYGRKYSTLAAVQRKGYSFAGWYTKKTGGPKVTASSISKWTRNATLYAHWSKVKV